MPEKMVLGLCRIVEIVGTKISSDMPFVGF